MTASVEPDGHGESADQYDGAVEKERPQGLDSDRAARRQALSDRVRDLNRLSRFGAGNW